MTSIDRLGRLKIACAFGVALLPLAAQADPADGRYYDHHGLMGWGGWFYGPILMLLFFALLIGAVVLVVRLLGSNTSSPGKTQEDRAHAILRERFAKGEIGKEEFEASLKVLDGVGS